MCLILNTGICTEQCNSSKCSYDGGDCTQLCNFTACNYTFLGDGICDPECRNKECSFDYCDCFDYDNIDDASDAELEQCDLYNETLCDIKTDCVVFSSNKNITIDSWATDNVCDNNCNNIYCNYDTGHCQNCFSSYCNNFWDGFTTAANYETHDYLVSTTEMCGIWSSFLLYFPGVPAYNCSQFVVENDKNGDEMLNGYEAVILLWLEFVQTTDITKASQINCSMCAPSVAVYYG